MRPDPRFVREGNDIFSTVDLTMTQAALGAAVTIPTLDGDIELDFDARDAAGRDRACCAGAACRCCRASAAATIACSSTSLVPRQLTDEQRRLLAEFDTHADEQTYKPDEGFFEKLKSAFR